MDERVKQYEAKMQKAYDFLLSDYAGIRAGRANPHVLDKLRVDYYGTPTPIQQVGNVTIPEARMIQIAPWEKSLIKDIEKAILASPLGLTPQSDGTQIRLILPKMTEERRRELVKYVSKLEETAKVAIRNARRDLNDDIKKLGLPEDTEANALEEAQTLTDKKIQVIVELTERKSKDLMTI